MNNKLVDLKWWDEFYSEIERGLKKYSRPADWKERAQKAETVRRKPARVSAVDIV